jgi:hypothetical protein
MGQNEQIRHWIQLARKYIALPAIVIFVIKYVDFAYLAKET